MTITLLMHGVDPNIQDQTGYTALMYASRIGNERLVDVLLKAGASKNKRELGELTAYDLAVREGHSNNLLELLKE